jgi:RimJ/RimL family protein N-acetyltransferase
MFQQEFVSQHPGYVAYRPRGPRTVTEMFDGYFSVLAWCRDHGHARLLADARGFVQPPEISAVERLELGEGAAAIAAGAVQVAIIAPEAMMHPERFAAVVANNRGLKVGTFTDEVSALEWLVGPDAVRPVLETERLALRWLTPGDAAFIQELVNQPTWLANIGERNVRSPEDAIRYITNGPRTMYAKFGFGLWCVVRKEDGIPVGLCGLLKRDYLDHPDIGYAFLERYQGKGYGSEACLATLAHARSEFGARRLMAIVLPTNTGSIRILEKLGMRSEGPFVPPGDTEELLLYGTGG